MFEPFWGGVGEALDAPLRDLLTWLIDPGVVGGDAAAALRSVDGVIDRIGGSVQQQIDGLREFVRLLARIAQFLPGGGALNFGSGIIGTGGGQVGSTGGGTAQSPDRVTVNVQGGSPEEIEKAVIRAVSTVNDRSGALR